MEDCDEDDLDQIVYADMDVISIRPRERSSREETHLEQDGRVDSRVHASTRTEEKAPGDAEPSFLGRTQAIGRAIRHKTILLSDGLQLQDEDERSEEASTVEEHIEQVDVSIVLIGNGEEDGDSNMSSQTFSSSSPRVDLSDGAATVASRPKESVMSDERSSVTSTPAYRPANRPAKPAARKGPPRAEGLSKERPTLPAGLPRPGAASARPVVQEAVRRQGNMSTANPGRSFVIGDRPSHWVPSAGKRPRAPPSKAPVGGRTVKTQRATQPAVPVQLGALRRPPTQIQSGRDVSFKPRWVAASEENKEKDTSEIDEFQGGGDHEADGFGSPGGASYAENFCVSSDGLVGSPSARRDNHGKKRRRSSGDRVGPLVSSFRQIQSRVEGDVRRLQSGAFPLVKFLNGRGVADHGDPRTSFTSYLDARLGKALAFRVEGFEAFEADVVEVAGPDPSSDPARPRQRPESSLLDRAVVVFKRGAVPDPGLQPETLLRVYNPCVLNDEELVKKVCTPEGQADLAMLPHRLVLCTQLHEPLEAGAQDGGN